LSGRETGELNWGEGRHKRIQGPTEIWQQKLKGLRGKKPRLEETGKQVIQCPSKNLSGRESNLKG